MCLFLMLSGAAVFPAAGRQRATFPIVEASISEMRDALRHKKVTSRELVERYLQRIALYNDRLHATIAVNANALAEADALDRERAQ